jgi:hypothetical protein
VRSAAGGHGLVPLGRAQQATCLSWRCGAAARHCDDCHVAALLAMTQAIHRRRTTACDHRASCGPRKTAPKCERARALIESGKPLFVATTVALELEWTLRGFCKLLRRQQASKAGLASEVSCRRCQAAQQKRPRRAVSHFSRPSNAQAVTPLAVSAYSSIGSKFM